MRWLLLSVGLAAGAFAAWIFSVTAEPRPGSEGADQVAMQAAQVLVAATDLPAGKKLVAEDLAWAEWPVTAILEGFVDIRTEPDADEKLVGAVIRTSLRKGMPLMKQQMTDGNSGFLSSILTPGMRAVALPISAAQTAGGFILPENRVDVLLSRGCRNGEVCAEGTDVEEILQNVRVLAIDQAGTVGPDGTAIVGETATLELSPEDARTLVAAQSEGILTLVLRAAGDMTETAPPPEPEVDEIEAAAQEAEAAAAAAAQVEPVAPVVEKPPRAVRVIRNGSAQSYEVN